MSRDSYKNAVDSLVRSCLRLSEATLAVLATPTVLARIYDGDVGECLGTLAETVEVLLDICLDDLDNDAEMARVLIEAARTIATSMKHLKDTWPWRNEIVVGRSLDEFDAGKGINVRDIIDDLQS